MYSLSSNKKNVGELRNTKNDKKTLFPKVILNSFEVANHCDAGSIFTKKTYQLRKKPYQLPSAHVPILQSMMKYVTGYLTPVTAWTQSAEIWNT